MNKFKILTLFFGLTTNTQDEIYRYDIKKIHQFITSVGTLTKEYSCILDTENNSYRGWMVTMEKLDGERRVLFSNMTLICHANGFKEIETYGPYRVIERKPADWDPTLFFDR